jgi:hypothetical protein
MKSKKTILTIIGILLMAIQLLGFIGMSRMYVGLYPSSETLLYVSPSSRNYGLNIREAFFAIEAGTDRFNSSFEDLTFPEYEYRVPSATQYTSAMVRESLGCSVGGGFGLFVYDAILTISYCFVGIIGVCLFCVAKIIAHRELSHNNEWKKKKKAKKISDKLNISADILAHCEFVGNDDQLMNYLQTCVNNGLLTQDQSAALFEAYKQK